MSWSRTCHYRTGVMIMTGEAVTGETVTVERAEQLYIWGWLNMTQKLH